MVLGITLMVIVTQTFTEESLIMITTHKELQGIAFKPTISEDSLIFAQS